MKSIIYDMVRNKEKLFVGIFIGIFIVLGILVVLYGFKYTRDVVLIKISDDEIEDAKFGFQRTSLIDGFFKEIPRGTDRLSYTIRDVDLDEIIEIGSISNLGEGNFYMTSLKFPEISDRTWEIEFTLKSYSLRVLDTKCYEINFVQTINGRSINQNEC